MATAGFRSKQILFRKMKKLLSILLLLIGISAQSQVITATVTVTNSATNGNTFSINGFVRTFTNTVTAVNTQILAGTNVVSTASNLFNGYAAYPQTSISILKVASNIVSFTSYPGTAATVVIVGTWGSVSYSTNSLAVATVVRVPKSVEGNLTKSKVANGLIDWITDSSVTNVIPANSPAFANFTTTNAFRIGRVQIASNATSVTVSGLALPFTPTVAGAWMGGSNTISIIGVQTEMDTITTNGATFDLDAPTDGTNYYLQFLFK